MELQDIYRDIDPAKHPCAEPMRMMGKRGAILGHMYLPGGEEKVPAVLMNHGYPGGEQNMDIAQALRRMGFAAMTYHYSGSWGSDGDFSFRNCLEDAETVLDTMLAHPAIDSRRIYVFGHSMGGFVAAHLTARRTEPRGTVLMCPWDAARSYVYDQDNLLEVLRCGPGFLRGTSVEDLLQELGDSAEALRLDHLAPRLLDRPLACIIAGEDEDLPVDLHARPFRDAMLAAGAEEKLRYEEIPGTHSFHANRLAATEAVARALLAMES